MDHNESDTESLSKKKVSHYEEESTHSIQDPTTKDVGFKTFLRLQFEVQFRFVVLTGVYLSVVCTLIDAALILSMENTEEIPNKYTGSLLGKYQQFIFLLKIR